MNKIKGTRIEIEYEAKSYRKTAEKCEILYKTYTNENFVGEILFLTFLFFVLKPHLENTAYA